MTYEDYGVFITKIYYICIQNIFHTIKFYLLIELIDHF